MNPSIDLAEDCNSSRNENDQRKCQMLRGWWRVKKGFPKLALDIAKKRVKEAEETGPNIL